MWTVATYTNGREHESERMTFGTAVDLRDQLRASGDMTAVVLEYFN